MVIKKWTFEGNYSNFNVSAIVAFQQSKSMQIISKEI